MDLDFSSISNGEKWGTPDKSKQVAFQKRLQRHNIDQFTLPYEDAKQLQRAASLVNVEYDPGEPEDTPENIAKRTFRLAGSEQKNRHKEQLCN